MFPKQERRKSRLISLLICFAIAGGFPGNRSSQAQEHDLNGIDGIPFPVSPPLYRQPVGRDALILQGNGGAFSHHSPNS
ncbi:MAG: hypothetical protein ABIK28_22835, partial [Planctomycetota bacterium]